MWQWLRMLFGLAAADGGVGHRPGPSERSPHWPAVERAHKQKEPLCQWCGRADYVEVHHIVPFEYGGAELDDANLISLCRPPGPLVPNSCHYMHGHRGKSWDVYDSDVRAKCDANLRIRM